MHPVRTVGLAAAFLTLITVALAQDTQRGCTRGSSTLKSTPTEAAWTLPVADARAKAKKLGRPLLIVSLNGNLDGYC